MASVLIVEDDGLVARHMAHVLRQVGHTPIVAYDARSALRKAADRPDIVLLDLGLPDLTGKEVLQHLKSRSETADIPVLVVTGRREAAARLRASEKTSSVSDILLKPFSAAQLCLAVNAALKG
jgi:DNA-binding response OmpR family regulator